MTYEQIIHNLNDESCGEEWDESWETLLTLDAKDSSFLPLLTKVVAEKYYNTTSKYYALEAISIIDPQLSRSVDSVLEALDDEHFEVQGRAARLLKQYKGGDVDKVAKALSKTVRKKDVVGVKKDAMVSLISLVGFKDAWSSLLANR